MKTTSRSSVRIDEIEGAARPVPAVLTERPGRIRRRRGAHGKAEAEAAARARKIEGIVKDTGLRPDLIRRHLRDRLGLEVPPAVQLAAVQQHLQEAGIVAGCRTSPAPPDSQRRGISRIPDAGHPETIGGKRLWRGAATSLHRRDNRWSRTCRADRTAAAFRIDTASAPRPPR